MASAKPSGFSPVLEEESFRFSRPMRRHRFIWRAFLVGHHPSATRDQKTRSLNYPRLYAEARASLKTARFLARNSIRAACSSAPRAGVPGQSLMAALIPFGPSAGIETVIDAGSLPKGLTMTVNRSIRIQKLNDAFRATLAGGKAYFTPSVSGRGDDFRSEALAAVQAYAAFSRESDPYGEHDSGPFTIGDERLFWRIDYYDLSLDYGSKDPADPTKTTRVLTIMLAEES